MLVSQRLDPSVALRCWLKYLNLKSAVKNERNSYVFDGEVVTRKRACARLATGFISFCDRYGLGGLTANPALQATCSGDDS